MKRKISFDIPKLKFGPSKQDVQALKQHLASSGSFESEPPTPKSVRPPLPSLTEAELRASCAWVVVNYRPSHIPYQQPAGIGVSTQGIEHVDYAAINAQVRREMARDMPAADVQWSDIPAETIKAEQHSSEWPSSDMFRYKPTQTSTDLFQQDDFDAMREQRSSVMAKADQLMANLEETQKILLSPEIRSHSRTASSQSALLLPVQDGDHQPNLTQRTDSVGTVTSTPRTDITGSAWAGSTAPTSAYVTPAPPSKRTSHTQADAHLPPRVTAVDAEWMRQELEKHLKAQEEETMRGDSPVQDATAVLAETTPTQIAQTPTSPQSVPRKPIPRRSTGEWQQNFSLRADSRHSKPHSRTVSHPESMPVSAVAKQVFERPSTSGRASTQDSKRARSHTQDSQSLVRPGTAQTTFQADAPRGRPRSRAQSMKGQVQNFSRPSLDAGSRKASVDISRPQSRGRSADSFCSAVSAISTPVDSSAKEWRNSVARRRSQDSDRSVELNSARTSESTRGRPCMPRHSPSPPPRRSINLNRQLPPLPGLDQWKPAEVETASPEPIVFTDEGDEGAAVDHPKHEQLSYPRRKDSLVNRRPTPRALHQSSKSSPTVPTFQARETVYLDTEPSQYYDQQLAPTNTRDPNVSPGVTLESQDRHARNRSVMDAASADLINHMSQVSLGQITTEQRPPTRQLNSAVHPSADKRHSRALSNPNVDAPNFSRKLSSDDYSRMYDTRYQHMLEVTPSPDSGDGATAGAGPRRSKSRATKGKRHWWQGRPKREENWMDAVIKSGSRSGVLLTDEVAGAPIVRY